MIVARAALVAALLATPAVAGAQPSPPLAGLYIAGGAGVNWFSNSGLTNRNSTFFSNVLTGDLGNFGTDPGFAGVVSLGWGFGNGLRAEIEGHLRRNNVSGASAVAAVPDAPGLTSTQSRQGGRLDQYGIMANAFYDFAFPRWPVIPYVGVGVGVANVQVTGLNESGGTSFGIPFFVPPGRIIGVPATFASTYRLTANEWNFAYQAILGAALPLDQVLPGLALTAEYRFFGTLDSNLRAVGTTTLTRAAAAGPGYSIPAASSTVGFAGRVGGFEGFNQSLMVGMRYRFGAAPPLPPQEAVSSAPAPVQRRTFLVFFDWDRADLTDRARQILAEAAEASRVAQTTRVEVAGHADRSGTPAYNRRLSQQRADAVAGELGRQGVARQQITIEAFGETRPLVPAADGAREPQNRRVEIVLR